MFWRFEHSLWSHFSRDITSQAIEDSNLSISIFSFHLEGFAGLKSSHSLVFGSENYYYIRYDFSLQLFDIIFFEIINYIISFLFFKIKYFLYHNKPWVCLQFFNISEKFWQYPMSLCCWTHWLKFVISNWHGFCCCWDCCCWGCCWGCCSWCELPPITLLTAWWAT